jgi:hypothetical protein
VSKLAGVCSPESLTRLFLDAELLLLCRLQDAAEREAQSAANAALREENAALLAQLHELHELLAQERVAAAAAAAVRQAAGAGAGGLAGAEAEQQLGAAHEEKAALEEQLEFLTEQNMVLQERLMALAFTTPADPLEGGWCS